MQSSNARSLSGRTWRSDLPAALKLSFSILARIPTNSPQPWRSEGSAAGRSQMKRADRGGRCGFLKSEEKISGNDARLPACAAASVSRWRELGLAQQLLPYRGCLPLTISVRRGNHLGGPNFGVDPLSYPTHLADPLLPSFWGSRPRECRGLCSSNSSLWEATRLKLCSAARRML